jgi:hypothetical protein
MGLLRRLAGVSVMEAEILGHITIRALIEN